MAPGSSALHPASVAHESGWEQQQHQEEAEQEAPQVAMTTTATLVSSLTPAQLAYISKSLKDPFMRKCFAEIAAQFEKPILLNRLIVLQKKKPRSAQYKRLLEYVFEEIDKKPVEELKAFLYRRLKLADSDYKSRKKVHNAVVFFKAFPCGLLAQADRKEFTLFKNATGARTHNILCKKQRADQDLLDNMRFFSELLKNQSTTANPRLSLIKAQLARIFNMNEEQVRVALRNINSLPEGDNDDESQAETKKRRFR